MRRPYPGSVSFFSRNSMFINRNCRTESIKVRDTPNGSRGITYRYLIYKIRKQEKLQLLSLSRPAGCYIAKNMKSLLFLDVRNVATGTMVWGLAWHLREARPKRKRKGVKNNWQTSKKIFALFQYEWPLTSHERHARSHYTTVTATRWTKGIGSSDWNRTI